MSDVITHENLREFLDDAVTKKEIRMSGDLLWSDEDLTYGLVAACREFNSIPPFNMKATDAGNLSADSNLFFYGAAQAIFRRKLNSLTAEHTSFEAGGITTNPNAELMRGMAVLAKEYYTLFREEATAIKANKNWRACFFQAG